MLSWNILPTALMKIIGKLSTAENDINGKTDNKP